MVYLPMGCVACSFRRALGSMSCRQLKSGTFGKKMDTKAIVKNAGRVGTIANRTSYDAGTMLLHWATAVLVVGQWSLAQAWGFFPHKSATRHLLEGTHISFGMLLTTVILLRIVWRMGPGATLDIDRTYWMERLAQKVHALLYVLLVLEISLGWTLGWSHGKPISFFGLIDFASPFTLSRPEIALVAGLHEWTGNILIAVAGLHAGAALFHYYVLKDDVLWRMLPRFSRSQR